MMSKQLIRYMVEAFDPQTNKFVLRKNTGGVSVTGEEVYCIFGLKNRGLDVKGILEQEGDILRILYQNSFLTPQQKILDRKSVV